jgi:glycosyltransferase involved in cell wall biosynthesis
VPPLAAGQSPVLSVIVPCYNLGLYLHEAIESVLAQTFRGFEIVVVDDGSTDEYTRLLLEHFDRPRTRIVHQENCGLPVARNEGIRQSSGRYVCCLDPDDRLRPEFFAEACKRLDEDPIVGFVSGYFEMFDEGEGVFRYDTCEFPELLVHNRAIEPAVFRRAGWEHVGGYCTSFSASGIEDWDLWIELIEAGYRASVIQETVWDYRIRADQMSAGMYQPGTWGRLVQELVQRHPDSYREHIVAVVAFHATRWADVRGWAAERSAGIGWWQRHAASWERIAAGRERLIQELQARLQTLEHPLQARSHEAGGDA